jgi:hypothetical protein
MLIGESLGEHFTCLAPGHSVNENEASDERGNRDAGIEGPEITIFAAQARET